MSPLVPQPSRRGRCGRRAIVPRCDSVIDGLERPRSGTRPPVQWRGEDGAAGRGGRQERRRRRVAMAACSRSIARRGTAQAERGLSDAGRGPIAGQMRRRMVRGGAERPEDLATNGTAHCRRGTEINVRVVCLCTNHTHEKCGIYSSNVCNYYCKENTCSFQSFH